MQSRIYPLLELLLGALAGRVALTTEDGSHTDSDRSQELPVPGLDLVAVLVAEVTSGTHHSHVHNAKSREPVLGVAREVLPQRLELLDASVEALRDAVW